MKGFLIQSFFLHGHDIGKLLLSAGLQALPLGPPVVMDCVVEMCNG